MSSATLTSHNAESIDAIAKRLNSLGLRLEAAAVTLRVNRTEGVEISHQAALIDGLGKVERWIDGAYDRIKDHLEKLS